MAVLPSSWQCQRHCHLAQVLQSYLPSLQDLPGQSAGSTLQTLSARSSGCAPAQVHATIPST